MATQSELFKANISQVLRTIWLNKGISRIDISKELQMDKSTVTKIVTYLLEMGIINSIGEMDAKPSGGRKPVSLSITIDYGAILGIEIQTDTYVAVIVDLHGNVIFNQTERIDFEEMTIAEMFLDIVELLKPHYIDLGLLGIVVGISGIINSRDGVIVKSNPLNISESLDFKKEIADKISIPVVIENDANCCCWGELTSLKADRPTNMLFILGEFREVETKHSFYSGIGFGFGIVINGKVYYGTEFTAGEFKSLSSLSPSISQFSLPDKVIEHIQDKPEELMKLFRELSRNLSLIVNFFNLSDIVIGGAIEQYFTAIELMLSQEIQQNWLHPDQMSYKIRSSQQKQNTVAYGAACMFLERLFGIPEMNVTNGEGMLYGVDLLNSIKR